MTADQLKNWANFFIAAASASSALAGLVMVALSVNVKKIINYRHLPARAGAAIAMLMLILVSSMASLMNQPLWTLACEIMVMAAWAWAIEIWTARQVIIGHAEVKRPRYETVRFVLLGQLQVVPYVVGGLLLLLGRYQGLYWIGAGTMLVFTFSVMESWVLLVEILR
ncbi:MAG TPA: hypothetical protein VLV87_11090 [Gammaproteobacteria bacterium]|nr:hypothetical protein [Gammaproteobacteria bacterium]